VTLGTENRNKTIGVIALVALALLVVAWELWPSSTTSASATVPAHPTPAAAGKKGAPLSTLDPTLRNDLLKESEDTKYEGNNKNIFVALPDIPQVVQSPVRQAPPPQQPVQQTNVPPPPPPINLKFYGFASQSGAQKKVFLSEGDDIFIAGEGDIVDRRYKVIRIFPLAVEIEDVLNNNRQQIPLTQG
jgi:hypothetical protein